MAPELKAALIPNRSISMRIAFFIEVVSPGQRAMCCGDDRVFPAIIYSIAGLTFFIWLSDQLLMRLKQLLVFFLKSRSPQIHVVSFSLKSLLFRSPSAPDSSAKSSIQHIGHGNRYFKVNICRLNDIGR